MPKSLSWVLLATVAAVADGALAQQPRERDVWFEVVDDGVRFGHRHVRVTRLAADRYCYEAETRLLVDLMGHQRQELRSRGRYVVDAALRPVSLEVETSDLTGVTTATGAMHGDQLVLAVRRGTSTEELRLDCRGDVIFPVCLADRLAALAAHDAAEIHEVDEELWQLASSSATRWTKAGAPLAVWILAGADADERRVVLDAEARLESIRFELQGMEWRRCPEQQARDVVHLELSGRELLEFPIDEPLPPPARLQRLVVRLTWRDIPLSAFELEDRRQRVLRTEVRDGQYTALVQVAAPAVAVAAATIPVDDPAFEPWLAETDFVKPHDAAIVAAARAAVGDERDGLAAARKLAAWVHGHIEGTLGARTLSGPEVLERKAGKCTEYATLFASVARAVGIPTRFALGERMLPGRWAGHMWNEVWVGRWVTVDASADEVDGTLALLKFVHSDSVMGTQPLRWQLTDSLEIAIAEYEATASALAGRYTTGIDGRRYTNVDYACRIAAPAEGWSLRDASAAGVPSVQFVREADAGVMLHFTAFAVPAGTPAKAITDGRLEFWRRTYPDLDVAVDAACDVAAAAGHRTRFSGTAEAGLVNTTTEVVWVDGDRGYLLNLISLQQAHADLAADFDAILASFEFLTR